MFQRNSEEPPVIPPGALYRAHLDACQQVPDLSKGIPGSFFTQHHGKHAVSFGISIYDDLFRLTIVSPTSRSEHSLWPNYKEGDAVELFLATKNWKEARIINRYCHCLVVFAEPFEGVVSKEVTQLRPNDRRPLLKDNAISVCTEPFGCGSTVAITIPLALLYGWEATEDLGFACRVYRNGVLAAAIPGDFSFETCPELYIAVHPPVKESFAGG